MTKVVGTLHRVTGRIYHSHTNAYPPLLHSLHIRWGSTNDFGLPSDLFCGRRNSVPVLSRDLRDIVSVTQLSFSATHCQEKNFPQADAAASVWVLE